MMILLAALALAIQGAAPPSTFCIEDRCQPVRSIPVTIAASETARNFVWISAELDQMIAGRIEPHATAVAFPDPSERHKLMPRLSDAAVKAKIDFELRCQEAIWKWSIPRVPARRVELRHARTGYTLRIASDGYERLERPLRDADLGSLFLQKLPVLSGILTDATTATPIGDAEVLLPEGKLLASTDGKGRFRSPVSGPWPLFVRVAATGYAPRTVALPKVAADTDLSIRLSKGGSLTISLAAPLGREEVKWEVRRL